MNLKQKLTGIVMLSCGIVLLLASGAFVLTEIISFRHSLLDKTSSLAELIGTNSRTSLTFRDPLTVHQTLRSLHGESYIRRAFIFDRDHKPIASYVPDGIDFAQAEEGESLVRYVIGDQAAAEDRHHFTSTRLAVARPILLGDVKIGTVYLESSLDQLYDRLLEYGLFGLGCLGILLIISYLLSLRLQPLIILPVRSLSETMKIVTSKEDFSVRVDTRSADEIGELGNRFNEMLAHLQDREEKIRDYRENLEQKVMERTEELERARHRAEAANQAKSRFLACMSHEIRTPMSGVLGMADLMLKTQLSSYQQGMTKTIANSGQALLTLLNDILDFSKIEAGKLELAPVDFDLHATIDEAVSLFAEPAYQKGLDLVAHVTTDIPRVVHGDPVRLRQILTNLVGNAVKFTDNGEICVKVTLQADGGGIHFQVCDTGIGIREEDRKMVFESFTQADNSGTRKYGGTGLGLNITREILTLMGGDLTLESRPGAGSCFGFTLHLPVADAVQSPEPVFDGAGRRVLVVEDHAPSRQMLVERLEQLRCRVDAVAGGNEALERLNAAALSQAPYFLALIDTTMEVPAGEGLAAMMGRIERHESMHRVIMCPQGEPGSAEQQAGSGVSGQLHKPISCSRLDIALREVLGGSGKPVAAPALKLFKGGSRLTRGQTHKGRILVAEDNETVRSLLELQFQSRGISARFVENGSLAVETLAREPFDAVLMDCNMPVMDGLEATRIIRQTGNPVPIIALSAHAGDADLKRFLDTGMNDCLTKPFQQRQLFEILDRWLP